MTLLELLVILVLVAILAGGVFASHLLLILFVVVLVLALAGRGRLR